MTLIAKPQIKDIISARQISEIWIALGGGALRYGRGRAFWRDGDGFNVSLSDAKGTWYDHARGEGGGVLDLIGIALQCSRADALKWLAEWSGMPLLTTTPQQRVEYAAIRQAATAEAQQLLSWRDGLLEVLREQRKGFLLSYHESRRHLQQHGGECVCLLCEIAWNVQFTFAPKIDDLDRKQ